MTEAEPTKQRRPYARINKNLLNRPLARDPRVHADWKFSKKHERFYCDLPGTKWVRFRLPRDAERRLPDGFDVAVLFLILREARLSESNKLWFASKAAMLRKLGVTDRVRHRRKLVQALTLWRDLSIRWDKWYREAKYENTDAEIGYGPGVRIQTRVGAHEQLSLPPPIKRRRRR